VAAEQARKIRYMLLAVREWWFGIIWVGGTARYTPGCIRMWGNVIFKCIVSRFSIPHIFVFIADINVLLKEPINCEDKLQ